MKTFEGEENDTTVKALSSVMHSYIRSKRTPFQCQLAVTVHGQTRSREIIDILKKGDLGIVMMMSSTFTRHGRSLMLSQVTCVDSN